MAEFATGIEQENKGNLDQALRIYEGIAQEDENYPSALINAGTIYYNRQEYKQAECCYLRALEVTPNYALAHFDIGNLYDATGRAEKAIVHYQKAIQLMHGLYADAHYNLALAYENKHQRPKALRHWRAYIKMDAAGPWADHARKQIKHIVDESKLSVVWQNHMPVRTPARAELRVA